MSQIASVTHLTFCVVASSLVSHCSATLSSSSPPSSQKDKLLLTMFWLQTGKLNKILLRHRRLRWSLRYSIKLDQIQLHRWALEDTQSSMECCLALIDISRTIYCSIVAGKCVRVPQGR